MKKLISQKIFACEAVLFLEDCSEFDFKGGDRKIFKKLMRKKNIVPGEHYLHEKKTKTADYFAFTFRAKPLAHKLCVKYGLYP